MALAVAGAGCRVVFSVLEGKGSAKQREIDHFEVLLFSLSTIPIILVCFVPGEISFVCRQFLFTFTANLTPSLPSFPSTHTLQL